MQYDANFEEGNVFPSKVLNNIIESVKENEENTSYYKNSSKIHVKKIATVLSNGHVTSTKEYLGTTSWDSYKIDKIGRAHV